MAICNILCNFRENLKNYNIFLVKIKKMYLIFSQWNMSKINKLKKIKNIHLVKSNKQINIFSIMIIIVIIYANPV